MYMYVHPVSLCSGGRSTSEGLIEKIDDNCKHTKHHIYVPLVRHMCAISNDCGSPGKEKIVSEIHIHAQGAS